MGLKIINMKTINNNNEQINLYLLVHDSNIRSKMSIYNTARYGFMYYKLFAGLHVLLQFNHLLGKCLLTICFKFYTFYYKIKFFKVFNLSYSKIIIKCYAIFSHSY